MPFRFEIDEVHRIIRAVFEGPCIDDDVLEAYYTLRLLWEQHGPANVIIDYSGVTDILISTEAVTCSYPKLAVAAISWLRTDDQEVPSASLQATGNMVNKSTSRRVATAFIRRKDQQPA